MQKGLDLVGMVFLHNLGHLVLVDHAVTVNVVHPEK